MVQRCWTYGLKFTQKTISYDGGLPFTILDFGFLTLFYSGSKVLGYELFYCKIFYKFKLTNRVTSLH